MVGKWNIHILTGNLILYVFHDKTVNLKKTQFYIFHLPSSHQANDDRIEK